MNNSRILFLLLISALAGEARAQADKPYSFLSLNIGSNWVLMKDAFQSDYTYKGLNPSVSVNYSIIKSKGQHSVDLMYSGGQLASAISPAARNSMFFLNYDYRFAIFDNTKFKVSVGPGLHGFASGVNYLPDVESPVTYFSGVASVVANGKLSYQLDEKRSFSIEASLPLAGVLFRPDFEINGKTLTNVEFVGNYSLLSTRVGYSRTIGSSLELTAHYQFSYFHYNQPRAVSIMQNGLFVGLKKKF